MRTTEVLLVDDNPADTDLTSEGLAHNRRPSHIHAVIDGVEAIAFLRHQGKYAGSLLPDFVLLDLSLPGKNGYTVLAEVRADPCRGGSRLRSSAPPRRGRTFCAAMNWGRTAM